VIERVGRALSAAATSLARLLARAWVWVTVFLIGAVVIIELALRQ
jgi:hypothetical protein